MKHQNFMLKVNNAKKADIRKALKDAGIEIRSLAEVYTEEIEEKGSEGQDAEEKSDG